MFGMPGDEAVPWDRLMEAADKIGPGVAKLAVYMNTLAGYAVAAAQIAALREAGVAYSFRPTGDREHPFGVFVSPNDMTRAGAMIGSVGLGADWRGADIE